jgi:hypothetical protein
MSSTAIPEGPEVELREEYEALAADEGDLIAETRYAISVENDEGVCNSMCPSPFCMGYCFLKKHTGAHRRTCAGSHYR